MIPLPLAELAKPKSTSFRKRKYSTGKAVLKLKKIPKDWDWIDFAPLIDIQSGNKIIPFSPYYYQKEIYRIYQKQRIIQIPKTRQLGITQMFLSIFLFNAIRNPAYAAIVLAKGQADTSAFAQRVREMVNCLKEKGYCDTIGDNLKTIIFKDGGKLFFENSNPHAARGKASISDVLFDEAAFPDKMEETFDNTTPCQEMVGDEARTIIVSTPNGLTDWFAQKLFDGNEIDVFPLIEAIRAGREPPLYSWTDNCGWHKILLHWRAHPIYGQNPNYVEDTAKKKKMRLEKARQEYDLSFTDVVRLIFGFELINRTLVLPSFSKIKKKSGRQYYAGIDTAKMGGDYFVCKILEYEIRKNTYKEVDQYRGNRQSKDYNLKKVGDLLKKYRPIRTLIEINDGGEYVLDDLVKRFPYFNLIPFRTSNSSKHLIINRLCLLMEKGRLQLVSDPDNKDEFQSFSQDGKKLEAISGKHDDIVIATALAASVTPEYDNTPSKFIDLF